MIRMLIWVLLAYIGYRLIKSLTAGKKSEPAKRDADPDAAVTQRDPVCGMYVSESDAVVGTLDGQRHYFCSATCLEKFREQLEHASHL